MKPPVEAPTSRQSAPVDVEPEARRARAASFSPPRETKRGGRSTASSASSSTCSPAFEWPGTRPGEHERLRLRARLGEAALDEQDVETLLHEGRSRARPFLTPSRRADPDPREPFDPGSHLPPRVG